MNLTTGLLRKRVREHDPAAMRQLARLVLDGRVPAPSDTLSPKLLLLLSARSSDRLAGWLVCDYLVSGTAGFERDREKATYWRDRTERRLRSDTQLSYSDPAIARRAQLLYRRWRRWLARNWPQDW